MKAGSKGSQNWLILSVMAICMVFALSASAQVQTEKTTTPGQATTTSTVERGEVVSVQGNDLIVKMENGEIRHFPNVPESARVTVDGKELGIHDLQPGMKLQRTITTTTTPLTITKVETVTGTVFAVYPPDSVILTLENKKNQRFKVPKGQKFDVNGNQVDVFHLKKGMQVSASKVTEAPATVVAEARKVTGTAPPPPPAPPANAPILIAQEAPVAPAAAPAAAATPAKLPKTASELPLIGLLGAILCALSLISMGVRKSFAGLVTTRR